MLETALGAGNRNRAWDSCEIGLDGYNFKALADQDRANGVNLAGPDLEHRTAPRLEVAGDKGGNGPIGVEAVRPRKEGAGALVARDFGRQFTRLCQGQIGRIGQDK